MAFRESRSSALSARPGRTSTAKARRCEQRRRQQPRRGPCPAHPERSGHAVRGGRPDEDRAQRRPPEPTPRCPRRPASAARQDGQVGSGGPPAVRRGTGPITVSTLAEAEAFADVGFRDITYAVGIDPHKLPRIAALRRDGVRLTVLLDSIEQAVAVAAAGQEHGLTIPALIEV